MEEIRQHFNILHFFLNSIFWQILNLIIRQHNCQNFLNKIKYWWIHKLNITYILFLTSFRVISFKTTLFIFRPVVFIGAIFFIKKDWYFRPISIICKERSLQYWPLSVKLTILTTHQLCSREKKLRNKIYI